MNLTVEQKAILEAIMAELGYDEGNAAYSPVRIDRLQVDIDKTSLIAALRAMAGSGLLLFSENIVTLSILGVNAYRMMVWIENGCREETQ